MKYLQLRVDGPWLVTADQAVPLWWTAVSAAPTLGGMTLRSLACSVALTLGAATTTAQEMRFFYPAPSPAQVRASKDVPYAGLQRALPIVLNPRRTAVKAAVMYYGSTPVSEFRRDLPLLYVRAGLDRPPVNRAIADLVALAVNQNAPVTLLNYPGGHHAFEIVGDEEATREVIDRTIAFVKQATRPAFQASLRRGIPESTAAAQVSSGRFAEAAATYAGLVKSAPNDPRLRLVTARRCWARHDSRTPARSWNR